MLGSVAPILGSLRPTFAEAAALPLTSLTVWEGLIEQAGVKVGATAQGCLVCPPPRLV